MSGSITAGSVCLRRTCLPPGVAGVLAQPLHPDSGPPLFPAILSLRKVPLLAFPIRDQGARPLSRCAKDQVRRCQAMSFGFRHSAAVRRNNHRRPRGGRFLRLEPLESRIALAVDCLGAISGTVAVDANGSGTIDPGEGVAGATVQLYRDSNGNNVFDPGTDASAGTDVTDTNGNYSFSGLTTDNYFTVQTAQTVNGIALEQMVSPRKSIDGAGTPGQVIDPFESSTGPVIDSFPAGTPVEETFVAADAIGGERELVAELTSGMTDDIVSIRTATGRLLVNPDFGAIGTYSVIWDGTADAPGGGVDPTGLGGVDLTEVGGVTGLGAGFSLEDVGFDQSGATIRLRVYSDAGNVSQAVLPHARGYFQTENAG